MDVWEEIESKVNSDSEVPVVKTSNKVGDYLFVHFQAKYKSVIVVHLT